MRQDEINKNKCKKIRREQKRKDERKEQKRR